MSFKALAVGMHFPALSRMRISDLPHGSLAHVVENQAQMVTWSNKLASKGNFTGRNSQYIKLFAWMGYSRISNQTIFITGFPDLYTPRFIHLLSGCRRYSYYIYYTPTFMNSTPRKLAAEWSIYKGSITKIICDSEVRRALTMLYGPNWERIMQDIQMGISQKGRRLVNERTRSVPPFPGIRLGRLKISLVDVHSIKSQHRRENLQLGKLKTTLVDVHSAKSQHGRENLHLGRLKISLVDAHSTQSK